MSRGEFIHGVLNDLCWKMGLGDAWPDSAGRLTLNFDDTPVTFSSSDDPVELVWIHADLGEIPADGAAAPTFLLRLAFDCWGYNRMTVGLDDTGRKAWGYTCVPAAQLSVESLERALHGLLEVAMPVRERLAKGDFDLPELDELQTAQTGSGDGMLHV